MNSNENLPPMVVAKLMKDIRALCKSPPEGIRVSFSDDNISTILADIDGPEGTPFEGGLFKIKLCLGPDFPNSPPKGFFITKVFHPNVSEQGEICVNTLKKDWKPTHGLEHVLMVIRCLLIYPNPESALNAEAGKLLLEQYEEFAKRAKLMTRIHAKAKRGDVAPSKKVDESDPSKVPQTVSEAKAPSSPRKPKPIASSNSAPTASSSSSSSAAVAKPKAPAVAVKKTGIKRL